MDIHITITSYTNMHMVKMHSTKHSTCTLLIKGMCIHKFVFEQALKRVAKTLAQQECLDLAMMSVKCCPL